MEEFNYSLLNKMNDTNSIDRFHEILKDKNNAEFENISNKILITLYGIDCVFRNFKKIDFYIYIEDDESVRCTIENALNIKIDKIKFEECIACIDFSKLIYRFICAKKFKVENNTISQLRINSWGREYIKEEHLLERYKEEYEKIVEYIKEYYMKNKDTYEELEKMLGIKIDISSQQAEEIKRNNDKVSLKILC